MNAAPSRRPCIAVSCGLPFSGKTTLLRAIADRTGAPLVSLDAINLEKGLVSGDGGISGAEWGRTLAEALRRIASHLKSGAELVLADDTSSYRFLRDQYRDLARAHHARHVFLYLPAPVAELRRRRRENAQTGARPPVADDVFDGCIHRFEPPHPDEPVVRCDHRADWSTGPALAGILAELRAH